MKNRITEKAIIKEKSGGFRKPASLAVVLMILLSMTLSACSGADRKTEDPGKTEIPGETEVLSVEEICLTDLQDDNDCSFVTGYNDSGRGIVYYLYYDAPEDHRAENYHYYLLRYETEPLTEAFWNAEPVKVHLCHKGEINGVDWDTLWMRFYSLRDDSKDLPSGEQWNPDESIGFWGPECEQPIIVQLKDCGKDYQKAEKPHKDQGILALLKAEYEILGTKKQLMIGVTPSKK